MLFQIGRTYASGMRRERQRGQLLYELPEVGSCFSDYIFRERHSCNPTGRLPQRLPKRLT